MLVVPFLEVSLVCFMYPLGGVVRLVMDRFVFRCRFRIFNAGECCLRAFRVVVEIEYVVVPGVLSTRGVVCRVSIRVANDGSAVTVLILYT